jgi:spermidine synthase
MLVVQSESPFFNADVIKMAFGVIQSVFALTKLYLANIPTYPSGLWRFTVGSKKSDPEETINKNSSELKYYNESVHKAAFKLPNFVRNIIDQVK